MLDSSATAQPPVAPTLRVLLTLAWPVVLARATQSVIGFTDAYMVAPLGEAELAATTTGALDMFTVILFPLGMVFILQSFASQLRGRGELGAIRRYARYGLVIALAAGVVGLGLVPLVPRVIGLLGYEPAVAASMTEYVGVRLFSVGAAVGVEALGNWYGGLGNTRLPMVVSILTMLANLLGNWLLISPRFGLPGYGVMGAAAASTIATFVGFTVMLVAFSRDVGFELPKGDVRMRRDEFLRVVRFGAPNGVNWLLEFAAFALFVNVVVGALGTTPLAALNVVIQVNSIAFMPAFGLATAGAILVGEAIGGGRPDDVPRIVRLTLGSAATFMLALGLIYLAFPQAIMSLFAHDPEGSAALVSVGASMLSMSVLWQLFDAVGITLGEALRAAGDTTWCMLARLFIAWGVFMPLAFAAVRVWDAGTTGAMLALCAYLAVLSLALSARFLSGRWRTIQLVGHDVVV